MIVYRKLTQCDLCSDLLASFRHNQSWDEQWVKHDNDWVLEPISGSRTWDKEKRSWIAAYLQDQMGQGGSVIGAFFETRLVGFACVSGDVTDCYINLAMLFVDDDFQRRGIGRRLFEEIRHESRGKVASKLFISAIPCKETIAFYHAVGCRDAVQILCEFVDSENDRFLEADI